MAGVRDVGSAAVRAPRAAVIGFWRGLTYPFQGMRLVMFQHPELIRYWIFPILITAVTFALVLAGVWEYHDALFEALWEEPGGDGFGASLARFFHGLLEVLFALLLLLVGLIVVVLLSSLFAAPFNDLLSEEVERLVTGRQGPPFSVRILLLDLVRTVAFELIYVALVVGLWLASLLLPVVGQIGASLLGFFITALYWAVSYIDWPASRRRQGLGFRFQLAARHFWAMSGFGTGVWIILFIPLLNLFFMPLAVAGGTLLYVDLEARGQGKPNLPRPG